jgi:hypothetical protein
VFFSDAFPVITTPKMIPKDVNNGLERRVSHFCTICDKNQPLNKTNRESYGSFSPQMARFQRSSPAADVSKSYYSEFVFCMGGFQNNICS